MSKMIGIKAITTMTRTLYIDVDENASEEEILKKANEEIIPPINAMIMASNALKRVNIRVDKLDLKDWDVINYNLEVIK